MHKQDNTSSRHSNFTRVPIIGQFAIIFDKLNGVVASIWPFVGLVVDEFHFVFVLFSGDPVSLLIFEEWHAQVPLDLSNSEETASIVDILGLDSHVLLSSQFNHFILSRLRILFICGLLNHALQVTNSHNRVHFLHSFAHLLAFVLGLPNLFVGVLHRRDLVDQILLHVHHRFVLTHLNIRQLHMLFLFGNFRVILHVISIVLVF